MMQKLRDLLVLHEGMRLKPYQCTAGKLTIGVGRNLEDMGISEPEARVLLQNDIDRTVEELTVAFDFYSKLTPVRKAVLIDMAFNLGLTRLMKFRKMIAALELEDYDTAAEEMLDSKWATDVGQRSKRLAKMMRTNQWPS